MHCTNASDGEESNDGFRNHGQVDGDSISFLDASLFKGVSHAADFAEELAIGDSATLTGLVGFIDDGRFVWIFERVTVNAVVSRI